MKSKTPCPRAWTLTFGVFIAWLLLLGVTRADAATITWHFAGPVTGYSCMSPNCMPGDIAIDAVVPLGTTVDVFVTIDPYAPTYPVDFLPCLWGYSTVTLQVLGQTTTSQAYVWEDAKGFAGNCGNQFETVEMVAPSWGSSPPGFSLPDGWQYFPMLGEAYFPGLWWSGHVDDGQPAHIGSQLPAFKRPENRPQRFLVELYAVPEPSTWLLVGTVLSAAAVRRRFR